MTLSSDIRKTAAFVQTGAIVAHPFTFKIFNNSDIQVFLRNTVDGTETLLTETADYTLFAEPNQDTTPGGTVTPTLARSSDYTITIVRTVDLLQNTDLSNQGGWLPETHETVFDKITAMCQQLSEEQGRVLRAPITDGAISDLPTTQERANKFLGFDENGDVLPAAIGGGITHDHTDAENGGRFNAASLQSTGGSANQVLTADGAGEAAWQTVEATSLGTTGGTEGQVPTINASNEIEWQDQTGTGGTGINYIDNGDAEKTNVPFTAYADAAASTPEDGTGGSPSCTILRTPSAIRGTHSFVFNKTTGDHRGEGFAVDFTIDPADKNKRLAISFDADPLAGYEAGDLGVFVYDVTNATLVSISNDNLIPGTGTHQLTFDTNTSVSYRLIFHVVTTRTILWNMVLDNIQVGPQTVLSAPVVTGWEEYTPTVGNVTGNITGRYRRIGDSVEVRVDVDVTSVTGQVEPQLPPGILADASKMNPDSTFLSDRTGVGTGYCRDVSTGTGRVGLVTYDHTDGVFKVITGNNQAVGDWAATAPFTWVSGDRLSFEFTVPIQGWDANQVIQPASTFDWAERYGDTAVTVTGADPTALGEIRYLRNGSDETPTDPVSVANGIRLDSNPAAGRCNEARIFVGKNKYIGDALQGWRSTGRQNAVYTQHAYFDSNNDVGVVREYSKKTGILTLWVGGESGNRAARYTNGASATSVDTVYLDPTISETPQALALAPAVYVEASSDAGQSITTSITAFIAEDATINVGGIYNTTTGGFTPSIAGVYKFEAGIFSSGGGGDSILCLSTANNVEDIARFAQSPISTLCSGSISHYMDPGETVYVNKFNSSGGASLLTDGRYSWLRITRVSD